MNTRHFFQPFAPIAYACIGACLLVVSPTNAKNSPNAKWFRYYDNGVPQTTKTVSNKHIRLGYEELDSGFRVIKKIPAYSQSDAAEKRAKLQAKAEAESKAAQAKNKLLQTYGSSERAMRKRKEMLGAILTKRSFAQQQLDLANNELNIELRKASNLEKSGKPVSDTLKQNIATKRAAVKNAQNSISDLMNNQMASVQAISQDIRRLRRLELTTN